MEKKDDNILHEKAALFMPKIRSRANGFGGVKPQTNAASKIRKTNEIIKENRIHFRWRKKNKKKLSLRLLSLTISPEVILYTISKIYQN